MKKPLTRALSLALSLLLVFAPFGGIARAEEIPEAANYEEMTALLRDGMLARETPIRFRYTGNDYRDPAPADLFAYCGDEAAGDYLRLSFLGAFPKVVREDDGLCTFTPLYYTTAEQEAAVAAYVSAVTASCPAGDDEAAARYLYDFLCENVRFDLENLHVYYWEAPLRFTAYGAVSEGKAVCQGFAQLYYRLARAAGLDCRIVTGTRGGEKHAWNIVKIGETWRHVDAACGAQVLENDVYFLQPLFEGYSITYGDYTAAEIRDYSFVSGEPTIRTGVLSYLISYTLNTETGALVISGTGDIPSTRLFRNDERIRSVEIGEGITGLCSELFYFDRKLKEVSLPASVRSIDPSFIRYCPVESIRINENNPVYRAAENCIVNVADKEVILGLDGAEIPGDGSVSRIGEEAFYSVDLPTLTIPDGVTDIGNSAFCYCKLPDSLRLPDSLETMADTVFDRCTGLKAVSVGAGVCAPITEKTFSRCLEIERFAVETGNAYYTTDENGILFSADKARLLRFPPCLELTEYTIPAEVSEITAYAFAYNKNLRTLTIPDLGISFRNNAFYELTALERVNVSDLAAWCEKNFTQTSNPLNNGAVLYVDGEAVTELTVPEGVTRVGANTFYNCAALTGVTLPQTVRYIRDRAFSGCRNLTRAVFADGLEEIAQAVFENCTGLTGISLPETVDLIGIDAFSGCESLARIDLPERMRRILNGAFQNCRSLTWIDLPEGLTSIETCTFYNCASLTDVTLPAGLKDIGMEAFSLCTSLKTLSIPDGVTEIRGAAFENCSALQSLRIPASVTSIGKPAFPAVNHTEETVFSHGTNLTIYGQPGSYAEEYAKSHVFPFRPVCAVTNDLHDPAAVEATAPTCATGGFSAGERCNACGEWLTEPAQTAQPLGHVPGEPARENEIPASCAAEGSYDSVIRCARCGELLSSVPEKLATLPHGDDNRDGYCDACGAYICEHTDTTLTGYAAATCTENGYSGDTVCAVCGLTVVYGATVYAAGHDPIVSKEAVAATCLAPGKTEEYACAVCGAVTTAAVPTPVGSHSDENGDGLCDLCRAPTDCESYGQWGADVYWYVDNGTLVLSGSGASAAFTGSAPWEAQAGSVDLVYVKEGVTAADGAAFNGCVRLTRVIAPAGTALDGCAAPVLSYTFTDGVPAITGATGAGACSVYDLLNTAYTLCLDHTVKALFFDRLQHTAAGGAAYTEYDVLKKGKIVDENHFRLPDGAVVERFSVKPAAYPDFNRVLAALGEHPDRNLILQIECDDLLPADLRADGAVYTEQLVIRFVDGPATPGNPAQPDDGDRPGILQDIGDFFRATLAAILALFKKIFKFFARRK